MHLELSTVRLGQLSERLAVPGAGPGDQVGRHHSSLDPRVISRSLPVWTPAGARTGRCAQFLDVAVSALLTTTSETGPKMMLDNKVAVIYGAGGAIGGAVARAFAREGARSFSTGRTCRLRRSGRRGNHFPPADAPRRPRSTRSTNRPWTASPVRRRLGGPRRHLVQRGRHPESEDPGSPLVDLDVEQFPLPIATYATSYFLTARLAARRMVPKSGVIMTVTAHHVTDGHPVGGRLRPGDGRQGGTHSRAIRRARASRPSRGRSADHRACLDRLGSGRSSRLSATALGLTSEQFHATIASRTHRDV